MTIEQAIYGTLEADGYRLLARSPGFVDDWLADAERLCTGFGERPVGVACPLAVFALLLNRECVAVVQVGDQGGEELAFRLLVLPRRLYAKLGGDPFRIADHFPPSWEERGELPVLEWTAGPSPRRTVEVIRSVLNVPESPTLLGGVQCLVDGGKLVFERLVPEPRPIRDLWTLLPDAVRAELWPASFVFENHHGFHAVVAPHAQVPGFEGYLREGQLGDYPEGQYELELQSAAERSDQAGLDHLFSRQSRSYMIRMALILLIGFILISLFIVRIPPSSEPAKSAPEKPSEIEPHQKPK
jgi:hypothetical protein